MIDKNEITRRLQEWIDQMERSGKHVNLDDINRHLGEIMHAQNAAPKQDFNGFSSEQMHQMLNRPLEVGCPVQLRRLSDEQIEQIPVMPTGSAPDECVERKGIETHVTGIYTSKDGCRALRNRKS